MLQCEQAKKWQPEPGKLIAVEPQRPGSTLKTKEETVYYLGQADYIQEEIENNTFESDCIYTYEDYKETKFYSDDEW